MNSETCNNASDYPAQTEKEDTYQLLINSVTDYAIFMLDPAGYITTWNTGATKIKQYEAKEIIGQHFSVFYTAQARAEDYPAMELREAKAHGRFEEEGWRVRKDGSVFWASVVITPVRNSKGELLGFAKVTRNLSERKKAEDDLYKAFEELKESEERFRLLIAGVTDYAIFMLDPAGNVATWNAGAKRMKGYEAEEIIGKYFAKFYSKEAVQQGYPEYELQQAREKGRFEDEGWRYRKDGSVFWANTILTAISNSKNEIIGYSKITRDLTDKKKLEQQLFQMNEELRESEEKSRLLVKSVKDYAILMLNPEGIIMSWNTGAEQITGYVAKEVIGRHFSVFYTREAIDSNFPQYELSEATRSGHFEDEGWRIRKDGTAFWANVVITPIYNPNNQLLGFAKITRDLTERRRNEELMLKNKELVRINNDLDNFVYTASHDLKAPIANMEGLLAALGEDLGPERIKHEKLLLMMEDAATTLKNVVSDLADIVRLQHEKENPESVELAVLVDEVKENLRVLIQASKAEIETDFSVFDKLKYSRKNLRSILYNLISNAIKYADPQRPPKVTIRTYYSTFNDYVLSVTDNGQGISQSQVNKIFHMFKRFHDHVEGSGIGLFLVKRILDNSGDRILVESELGKGSEFSIYFKHQEPQA